MCYSASTIARFFIQETNGSKTPMQLNKMTYIAHGWCPAIYNRPLIVEDIEAWKYGPVVPVLYYLFKQYGHDYIPVTRVEEISAITKEDRTLLEKIIEVYGNCDGIQLSAMTHRKGTPWHQVWHQNGRNSKIPNSIIKDYYVGKAKQSANGA